MYDTVINDDIKKKNIYRINMGMENHNFIIIIIDITIY